MMNNHSPNNFRFSLKERLTPREKVLVIIIVILFILLVIFFGLFIAFRVKYDEKNGSTEFVSTFVPSENVCQTLECLESAATIAKSINTSVDPCDDFYQFACGRWMAEHPVPLGANGIDNSILIDKEIKQTLKGLLTIQDETAPEAVKQARAYFRSCQDAYTRENEGSKPVLDLFNLSGSGIYPTLQPSWNDTGMTFSDIVEYLSSVGDLGVNVFIPMLVMQDEMHSDRNIIKVHFRRFCFLLLFLSSLFLAYSFSSSFLFLFLVW
ncbi:neprilysin-11-like [Pomacea canaliculata]|uniref:neprilysin-11-like n=1 Tax=Pomacea canaliculata TaxID=400727 RepID=UPI000D73F676|nr:neprilysin-11-like [Pomacea canaliculata]